MAKTGVETDVSQQFRKTGVETGQQLFSLSVNQVCLNSVSTLSRSPWPHPPARLRGVRHAYLVHTLPPEGREYRRLVAVSGLVTCSRPSVRPQQSHKSHKSVATAQPAMYYLPEPLSADQ